MDEVPFNHEVKTDPEGTCWEITAKEHIHE